MSPLTCYRIQRAVPSLAAMLLLVWAPAHGLATQSHARAGSPPALHLDTRPATVEQRTSSQGTQQELDELDRTLPAPLPAKLACPEVPLVDYRGSSINYAGAVRVHPSFQKRLELFESVASEVAERVYGRAPTRVRQAGSYRCRAGTGHWSSSRLSEHALGNALDVFGFDFGPAPKKDRASLPKAIRGPFSVTVARSWDDPQAGAGLHARFLHELIAELRRRQVFRGMIGPSDPLHTDHFHLDGGPWTFSRI